MYIYIFHFVGHSVVRREKKLFTAVIPSSALANALEFPAFRGRTAASIKSTYLFTVYARFFFSNIRTNNIGRAVPLHWRTYNVISYGFLRLKNDSKEPLLGGSEMFVPAVSARHISSRVFRSKYCTLRRHGCIIYYYYTGRRVPICFFPVKVRVKTRHLTNNMGARVRALLNQIAFCVTI